MRTYATVDDVKNETGLVLDPEDGKTLLRRASLLVENAASNSSYEVDEDGYPSEARVRELFMVATCLQVKALDDSGGTFSMSTEGPAQLGSLKFGSESGSSGGSDSSSGLDPEVGLLMASEGLLSSSVRVRR